MATYIPVSKKGRIMINGDNGKCPMCRTKLHSQVCDSRRVRIFCPNCGYENIFPMKFEMQAKVK
jgi:hypothetical protein